MKALKATTALLLLTSPVWLTAPSWAAEYQGKNIDGRKFAAKVYPQQTSGVYDADVEFKRQSVVVYFAGGQTTLRLTQSVITDPSSIIGFGRLGHVHVVGPLSIGLDYDRSNGNYPSPIAPTRNDIWRISLDATELERFVQQPQN